MANVALVRAGLNQLRGVNEAAIAGPVAPKVWAGVLARPTPPTPPADTAQFFM